MGEEHLLLKQELTQQQRKIKGSYYSLGIKALQWGLLKDAENKMHWPGGCWRDEESQNCWLPEKPYGVYSFTRYGLCVSHCALPVCLRTCLSASGSSFQTSHYTKTVQTQLFPPKGCKQRPVCKRLWTRTIWPSDMPFLTHPVLENPSQFQTESHPQFRSCFLSTLFLMILCVLFKP